VTCASLRLLYNEPHSGGLDSLPNAVGLVAHNYINVFDCNYLPGCRDHLRQ
jgi:hypothetical protein